MVDVDRFSGWGTLAKVRFVEDEHYVYLQLQNGNVGWAHSSDPVDFAPGTPILITGDQIEEAPDGAWREDPWIGVVRIKNDDRTVLEFAGQTRVVPTNTVPYEVGYTVEALITGVIEVLSKQPIRLLDLPEIDDSTISNFLFDETELTFDDFGGIQKVVDRARELIETPLRHRDELAEIGARAVKGILFTGEPGTGKTMLARIIARETNTAFYQIKGPEIVSRWYGQSEEILRKLFDHASKQESAIIFFDEIDSVAAQRDEDAHEASKRIVAQLLTLMDGVGTGANIVVIAATNRPDDIDTALRRPGRFDWEIKFPHPDRDDRHAILSVSARKLKTSGAMPHDSIADLTEGWSAAELTAIWTEAALLAANDGRKVMMAEDYFEGYKRVADYRASRAARVARAGENSEEA